MKPLSGKEFAKLLEQTGWELKKINGSHHIYMKKGKSVRVSLLIHANRDLKTGLMKHLMKIAEIDESEF